MTRNWNEFFTAEDFGGFLLMHGYQGQYQDICEEQARRANQILREAIRQSPKLHFKYESQTSSSHIIQIKKEQNDPTRLE